MLHTAETMDKDTRNFFLLLQYALGNRAECPVLTLREWRKTFNTCQQQGLTPFVGNALVKAGHVLRDSGSKEQQEFTRLIMQLTAVIMQCEAANRKVSSNAIGVVKLFHKAGFECCLLKGQGNSLLYPTPSARTPGDIDLWVRSISPDKRKEGVDKDARRIIAFARKMDPKAEFVYHHVECPPYKGTPVEAHYRPQFMFSLWHNSRLQHYFTRNSDRQFSNLVSLYDSKDDDSKIAVPTAEFNIVFQLSHIFNHLFHEGIGLRQLLDYYYVLMRLSDDEKRQDWEHILDRLGLLGLGRAVMWILVNSFGMDQTKCIVAPDSHRGRFVLNEIMMGGNFGQYDKRDHFGRGHVGRNLQRLWRDARLLRYFPTEAMSEPLFRLWHFLWRQRH